MDYHSIVRFTALAMLLAYALPPQYGPVEGRELPPTDLERIRPGQSAPNFVLPAADGSVTRLSDFRGRNLVLVFYRGHW